MRAHRPHNVGWATLSCDPDEVGRMGWCATGQPFIRWTRLCRGGVAGPLACGSLFG